ncbi:MAG: thiamine diphosphokinase [Clostridia bacterium]|nr:thiamine diphosphokinase [Clostridia bacterium]
MKRCVIVCAGDVLPGDIPEKREGELWIAADGGCAALEEAGIVPDLFIGDLDSCVKAPEKAEAVILPAVKDDTDAAAAVKAGFDRGYTVFLIVGGLGGKRLSHTLANIQLLSYIKSRGGRGALVCGGTRVFAVSEGETAEIAPTKGYFSLFPAGDSAVVSVSGAKYPGDGITLSRVFPLGVSNETDGVASVTVKSGEVFVTVEE